MDDDAAYRAMDNDATDRRSPDRNAAYDPMADAYRTPGMERPGGSRPRRRDAQDEGDG